MIPFSLNWPFWSTQYIQTPRRELNPKPLCIAIEQSLLEAFLNGTRRGASDWKNLHSINNPRVSNTFVGRMLFIPKSNLLPWGAYQGLPGGTSVLVGSPGAGSSPATVEKWNLRP